MGGGLRWTPGHRQNIDDRRFDPPAVRDIADGVDGHRITQGDQNMSQAMVARAKAELQAEGADLSGPCGAFRITKRAAQLIGHPAGLLDKPAGNNCEGFATDIICYPDGHIYDVLIDGGGANGPSWQDKGKVDPARYRAVSPVALPPPGPGQPSSEAVLVRLDLIAELLKEILEELRTGG